MHHLPTLINDLGIILTAAGVVTLLFKRFRQPVVLGYILAGFLISSYVPIVPTISDPENIKVWAEIGIIFLLFGLGLEFSFKKLADVGAPASITAVLEVTVMSLLGFITGKAFGWSTMDSIFLGGILSISSTTIIIRAFEEVGVKGRGFVSLVFGVLIVEDLVAILLLVLLSTIAISQNVEGLEIAYAMAKLVFFLTLWFISGIFLIPTALGRLRPHLTQETLLIVSLSLCFLMVILATKAGFSPALGAFIMGSLLAETSEAKRIEHLVDSVKNLFAAIFFVSVGMLIDPRILTEYAIPILVLTLITIFGKAFSTALGVLLSGRSLRHAVQSGLSLAQIGEFSFIIAVLGLNLKVTSDFLYPVAVGVSAVTTFTTPYLIRSADKVFLLIEQRLSPKWQQLLNGQSVNQHSVSAEWKKIIKTSSITIIANAVLMIAIFLGIKLYVVPILKTQLEKPEAAYPMGLLAALLLSAPFFWAMVRSNRKNTHNQPSHVNRLANVSTTIVRWFLSVTLLAILSTQFIALKFAIFIFIGLSLVLLFMFSRELEGLYQRLEGRFFKNLDGHDPGLTGMPPLAPWDAHLVAFEVHPQSDFVGKTLEELKIREHFGVTIALIERGNKKLAAPGRNAMIFPYDKVFVIGTDEQILQFRNKAENIHTQSKNHSHHHSKEEFTYVLVPYFVAPDSPFCGRSIRDSGVREKSHGLIVGVERDGQRILNPDSSMTITASDTLWIVGEKAALGTL